MPRDGTVLMVAHMNAEALRLTQETGIAHFWSRSRKALWKKGETSGETLKVTEILTDCDQDVLQMKAEPQGQRCRLPHWTAQLLLPPRRRRQAGLHR